MILKTRCVFILRRLLNAVAIDSSRYMMEEIDDFFFHNTKCKLNAHKLHYFENARGTNIIRENQTSKFLEISAEE